MDFDNLLEKDPENKFQIDESREELSITYRWFSFVHIFLAFFCLIWDGFLVVWYSIAFASFNDSGGASLIMILFPVLHLAAGVGLTYYTICGFFNRTYLRVDRQRLSISFKPLPWKGQIEFPSREIKQLFVKEKVSRGKNGNSYTYNLCMLSSSGKEKVLLSGDLLGGASQARFLEQKIEHFLGIQDFAVPGEYMGRQKAENMSFNYQQKLPRKMDWEQEASRLVAYDLYKGCVFDFQSNSWEVNREVQFDWENGYTHRQIQAFNKKENTHLYMWKDGDDTIIYEEGRVNLFKSFPDIEAIVRDKKQPPATIKFEEQTYWRDNAYRGQKFLLSETGQPSFPVTCWLYFNENKNMMFRIEDFDNFDLQGFSSTAIEEREIQNLLPSPEKR